MAGEALFVFGDADTEMSVLVRDCDVSRALNMIHKTLVSDMCAPIDSFDALEFATTFVAATARYTPRPALAPDFRCPGRRSLSDCESSVCRS